MPSIKPIHHKKFQKFLKYIGCTFKRQKGDHIVYTRSDLKRPIIFPAITSIPVFIILNNLRVLKLSRDQYLDIIKKL